MGRILNVPNWITIIRLATLPIIVVLMVFLNDDPAALSEKTNRVLSFVVAMLFSASMGSDLVDGYYARRYGLTSTFGKFIDPLADKLLFLAAMVMMIPLGRIPAWVVVIFLVRETVVTALRSVAVDEGIIIAASRAGKYKSAFLSATTISLLLHYHFFGINWRFLGYVFLVPSLILSVASGLHYIIGFLNGVRNQRRPINS